MKRILLALVGAFALALAVVVPANAIVGGAPAPAPSYIGSMQDKATGAHGCGATLVSADYAMTAFHCVENLLTTPEKIQVRFGSSDRTTGGVLTDVSGISTPPNARLDGADIALLKLSTPVTSLAPAQLPAVSPAIGSQTDLVGWGLTCTQSLPPLGYCGDSPTQMHKVTVPLNPDWLCSSIIYGINGSTELCLGNYFAGKTACYGDSGGPAIIGDRVVGVTSRSGQVWLYGNCQLAPIIYTDVSAFVPWIKTVTGI